MRTGKIIPAGIFCLAMAAPAFAGELEDALGECAAIAGSFKRLDCYDGLARESAPAGEAVAAGKWQVEQRASGIGDAVDVYMAVAAVEKIPGDDGEVRPALALRCENNNTAVIFSFARFIEQSRAEATLRIDDGGLLKASLKMSGSGKAFGFWRGSEAVPFLKRLLGAKRLLVQVTPFGARPVVAEFPIAGLDEAIAPLRKACGW